MRGSIARQLSRELGVGDMRRHRRPETKLPKRAEPHIRLYFRSHTRPHPSQESAMGLAWHGMKLTAAHGHEGVKMVQVPII